MVRNSLVENRIRFDSDKGGGPDRSNPAEMAQREARARASVGFGTQTKGGPAYSTQAEKEYFADRYDGTESGDRLLELDLGVSRADERQAALRQADERAARATGDARQDILNLISSTAQQSLDARPSTSTRTTGLDRSFFGDAYKDLYGGKPRGTTLNALLTGGPTLKLATGLFGTPTDTPTEQMAKSAGQLFSLARANMTPEEEAGLISGTNAMFDADTGTFSDVPIGGTGGTMSTGFLGAPVYSGMPDDDYSGPFERQVRGSSNDKDGDGPQTTNVFGQPTNTGVVNENAAAAGAIPSSELALNYLQNPYYAYSGFGNQYNPYGFANNTLVDLLQTRNLTQPGQADTLGLFGNPTDFS